jgi:hypothetical protein
MPDYSLSVSYQDGRWSAHHVCDPAEELPALDDLREERLDTLRGEWPDATDATLAPYAQAWAEGWLAVAERERVLWIAQRAAACEED